MISAVRLETEGSMFTPDDRVAAVAPAAEAVEAAHRNRLKPSYSQHPHQATMPTEENKEFDDELVDYEEDEETTTDATKAAEGKDAKK
ncbi:hypothetical protein BBJ28_00016178 [Nothophytophthora sp. Chile5]|nr:hypothetical protein BBJ28_00016178 [Nothophytophthora sp. Chile5]